MQTQKIVISQIVQDCTLKMLVISFPQITAGLTQLCKMQGAAAWEWNTKSSKTIT